MALGPRLDLRQSQSLVMTPQLQQAIRLLAASNLEIETFIAEALEANPLLETGGLSHEAPAPDEGGDDFAGSAPDEITADQLIAQGHGEAEAPLDLAGAALDRDVDTGDGARSQKDAEWGASSGAGGGEGDDGDFSDRSAAEVTLREHLESQVGALARSHEEDFAARHIIGLLDDAGYLPFPLHEVAEDLGVAKSAAEAALRLVQSLDPSGVGARDLAECIAIQAREADRYDPCMAALIANLDLVARGEVERLKRLCRVDDEDFADMLRELRSYDPKPGLAFAPSAISTVVPDILVSDNGKGGWDIAINEETLPRLIVNRSYLTEVSAGGAGDPAANAWLKEKLADAHWLIRALDQRQRTILKTAAEIVRQQDGFFRRGVSDLRPLTLREVAEKVEMHE
ncbi:MAG: RNA polymerase sigma-54 factor, partial [Erythrobacter sp.]